MVDMDFPFPEPHSASLTVVAEQVFAVRVACCVVTAEVVGTGVGIVFDTVVIEIEHVLVDIAIVAVVQIVAVDMVVEQAVVEQVVELVVGLGRA
jgi:hypothetical protein